MRIMRVVSALGALVIGASCAAQDTGFTAPTRAQQDALQSMLRLPAGFTIKYFATGLAGVRFMAIGADGAVYASLTRSGQVVRLADTNGDGVADTKTVVLSGLERPHGLAFHDGWFYVAQTSALVRVKLTADGAPAGAPEVLAHYTGGGNHSTRSIAFGADGKLYLTVGSSCNVCIESDSDRATVLQFDADGTHGHIFASGLRNPVGIAMEPVTKAIWVSQNERDNLEPSHEDLPPDEINILQAGGDYGWPYCYSLAGKALPNPEYHDAARCARTIPAALDLQAHSAPLGMSFLAAATMFPAEYRGDLLLAFHGSWNRSAPTGVKVVRVRVTNGRPTGYEDFITGWLMPDGTRWGRPVGVVVAADGSVLVSDDAGGAIYRVAR